MSEMQSPSAAAIGESGLWSNNPGLVQLLGLCPLLGVSVSVVNALSLGLATMLVLGISGALVSLLRPILRPEIRIPLFVLVIAATVSAIEMLFHAWLPDLYRVLGLFIPLIVTNCAVLGRAEAFASRHNFRAALLDGLAMGLGFAMVLLMIGGMRELLGQGTLMAGMDRLFGPWAVALELRPWDGYRGFVLALMPPGAFFALAALVAWKQHLSRPRPVTRGTPSAAPAS